MFAQPLEVEVDKDGKQSRERFEYSDESLESSVLELEELRDCILTVRKPETDGMVGF
jgi:hypothetical protein